MRSNTLLRFFVLVCLAFGVSVGWGGHFAAKGQDEGNRDEQALRQLAEKVVEAFNKADIDALVGQFAPEAELVDEEGNLYQGRAAIAEVFSRLFEQYPGVTIAKEIEEVRFLSPNIVIEDGLITFQAKDSADSVRNRFTSLKTRDGDRWFIASLRQAPAEPILTPREQLEPLAWLVGDWVSEEDGIKVHLSCKWSEDENYLLGQYSVEVSDQETLNTDQRIAWDAAQQAIRSWNFDTDGGFSEADWSTDGSSWVVKSKIVLPEGLTGSATFYLTPVDENKFLWSTMDRVVGGVLQPSVEVTIVRQPPQPAPR